MSTRMEAPNQQKIERGENNHRVILNAVLLEKDGRSIAEDMDLRRFCFFFAAPIKGRTSLGFSAPNAPSCEPNTTKTHFEWTIFNIATCIKSTNPFCPSKA